MLPTGIVPTLWDYRAVAGGVADIVATIARYKCSGLAVKTHDGEWGSWLTRNQSAEFVARLHDEGKRAWAWGYTVGNYEGNAIGFEGTDDYHHCTIELETEQIARAREAGYDGYFFDPEMEVSRRGQADPHGHMATLLDRARQKVGADFPLGAYNVPRANGGFPDYPIAEMVARLGFFAPQVYCVEWGIEEQIETWLKRGMGLLTDTLMPAKMGGRPVAPELDAADNGGNPPAPGYVLKAAQLARGMGAIGLGMWHYGLIARPVWEELAEAAQLFADAPLVIEKKVDTGFQHAPGWLDPVRDDFDWSQDGTPFAGIVTYRGIRVYNDQEQKSYWREWDAARGFGPPVEVK